jgi:uncharacterized protein HemY
VSHYSEFCLCVGSQRVLFVVVVVVVVVVVYFVIESVRKLLNMPSNVPYFILSQKMY